MRAFIDLKNEKKKCADVFVCVPKREVNQCHNIVLSSLLICQNEKQKLGKGRAVEWSASCICGSQIMCGAEIPITEIAHPGHNVILVIEATVNGRGDDMCLRISIGYGMNTLNGHQK